MEECGDTITAVTCEEPEKGRTLFHLNILKTRGDIQIGESTVTISKMTIPGEGTLPASTRYEIRDTSCKGAPVGKPD